ncbi:MAG: tetratricopeptide repeat protein [Anaerolineae bacterium]
MPQNVVSGYFDTTGISAAAMAAYGEGSKAANRQDYAKAIEYYTEALAFEGTRDSFRARVLEYRGLCHWLLGDFDAAGRDYRASLTVSDDQDQMARARVRLGELADFRGYYGKAEELYRQALAEGTAAQNLSVIGRARRGLGILNRRQGHTETAIRHLSQALAVFRQTSEAREQARVLISLGRTRHARGEYQHALTAYGEALSIVEAMQDRWRVVQTINEIGECHQALYDIENALRHHEHALRLAEEYGANLIKPEIERNLGVDLIEENQFEEGMTYLKSALNGARRVGDRELEALALFNLTQAYLSQDCVEEAAQAAAELGSVAEALPTERFRALTAFASGEVRFRRGDRAAAAADLNQAMLAAQTSVDRSVLWKLHATLSQVVDNEAIATVHCTLAADFIREMAEELQDRHLKSCFVHAPPVTAVLKLAGVDPDFL